MFILDYIKKDTQNFYIFMAHHMFFGAFENRYQVAAEEIAAFRKQLTEGENSILWEGDYPEVLAWSDAFLGERSAVTMEMITTGKPVCYLAPCPEEYNRFGKEVVGAYVQAENYEKVEEFLKNFTSDKKGSCRKVYEKYILPYWDGKCGERIKNDIMTAVYEEIWANKKELPKVRKNYVELDAFSVARVDMFNEGDEKNILFFYGSNYQLSYPMWFNNPRWRKGGIGAVLEFCSGWFWQKHKIEFVSNNSGKLIIQFKSNKENLGKHFLCYKNIKFDGKMLQRNSVCVWHDKPFYYEVNIQKGVKYRMSFKVREKWCVKSFMRFFLYKK